MTALADSLEALLEALTRVDYPLALPGRDELARRRAALAGQIRDYLLPRAQRLDAPLLAVVGGSTGAGKSTLVNSLLGREVSRPGVLRPTTKAPVLVAHPSDAAWFRSPVVLPELTRTDVDVSHSRALRIVEADVVPQGLALLDAPDVDSVDDENRHLARQLLKAADLWLFVTSAARYADAVPWELLREAAARQLVLAVVINRCPPGTMREVAADFAGMLREEGLGEAPMFALTEARLADGLLAAGDVAPIRRWLSGLVSEAGRRAAVVRQSLQGSLGQLDDEVAALLAGLAEQRDAAGDLRQQAEGAFETTGDRAALGIGDGTMLRDEIVAHWHDVVGTAAVLRGIDERVASLRARARRWFGGEPKAERMQEAVGHQLTKLIVNAAEEATDRVAESWSRTAWGRELLDEDLRVPGPRLDERAAAAVRGWQQDVLALVAEQGKGKRMRARFLALGTNALGATLMVVVFASTGGLTGAEAGIAGGTSIVAQRLLESVFGAGAVERLAKESRTLLEGRIRALLADEAARFTGTVEAAWPGEEPAASVGEAAEAVRAAREQL